MRSAPIRIVIADDHRLFRQGLRLLLSRHRRLKVVGEARDGEEAVLVVRDRKPDLLLLDLDMPVLDGIAVTRILAGRPGLPRILILSSFEDDARVVAAMRAGAAGFVAKRVDIAELVSIIESTVAGGRMISPFLANLALAPADGARRVGDGRGASLTARELQVLRLLVQGRSNRDIGIALRMSRDTVKGYLKGIFEKLQVSNRTQAAVMALQYGAQGAWSDNGAPAGEIPPPSRDPRMGG